MTGFCGSNDHGRRVQFLEVLGDLIGCFQLIGGELPDGRRPDVLRIDRTRELLLLADAKSSESPYCTATRARLFRYLQWVRSYVDRPRRIAVFALCCPPLPHMHVWKNVVMTLASDIALYPKFIGSYVFTRDYALICFIFAAEGTRRLHSRQAF